MLKRLALLAVTAAFAATSHATTVKQSSSGICHDQSSSTMRLSQNP